MLVESVRSRDSYPNVVLLGQCGANLSLFGYNAVKNSRTEKTNRASINCDSRD